MKQYIIAVLGGFATALAVSGQTETSSSPRVAYYAEPAVIFAFPGDFDNAVGGALAIGATINGRHSIEAELISFTTKEYSDDMRFTPMLATYRYNLALGGGWSMTVGASVGATLEKYEYFVGPAPGGFGGYSYNISQTAFTSGLVGGISYAFTPRVSLDASAQVLRLEKTDVTTAGNMALFTLGVKFRF